MLGRVTTGADYTMTTVYFPAAGLDGRRVEHTGLWTMTVERAPVESPDFGDDVRRQPALWKDAVDFRAYVIAEIPQSNHAVRFRKSRYTAGEDIVLEAAVREAGGGFRVGINTVTASITTPADGFGTFLSQNIVSTADLDSTPDVFGDQLPDLAARKSMLLLTSDVSARIAPIRSTITLYDDGNPAHGDVVSGDGRYAARIGTISTPGLVSANVTLSGQSHVGGPISRDYKATTFVTLAAFDPSSVTINVEILEKLEEGGTRTLVTVTPRDVLGNYMGPGHANEVQIDIEGVAPGRVTDLLDGRYSRELVLSDTQLNADVVITVDDTKLDGVALDSFLEKATLVPFWVVILLGLVILALLILIIRLRKAGDF